MSSILSFLQFALFLTITGTHSREKEVKPLGHYQTDALWKKEYEKELTDAMIYGKKRDNVTRVALSPHSSDNDAVIEKIMDTITSSEKYLKKVDNIDYKLNRLDIEVHDKTNDILKYLAEIMKAIRSQSSGMKTASMIEHLITEVDSMKKLLVSQGASPRNRDHQFMPTGVHQQTSDIAALEAQVAQTNAQLKTVSAGVESIISTISEVKNRQYTPSTSVGKADSNYDTTANLVTEFRRTLMDHKSKKCDCPTLRADKSDRYPLDCYEIQMQGFNVSGIFKIHPDGMEPFYVLCDLTTAGGGWTVFQNRFDGTQDFYKSWVDYKYGFGNLAGEFWLGLDKLHYLTNQKLYELRVELETQNGHEAYAVYSVLTIGPEYEGYRISTLGTYYGTAGDSLSYHAGQKFSALDVDNDEWKDGSCAVEHGGAWWYKECDKSNLNGFYVTPDEHRGQTIYWISFKGPSMPLTRTKMMIRPLPARRPLDYHDTRRPFDYPEPSRIHATDSRADSPRKHISVKGGKTRTRRPENYSYSQQHPEEGFFSTYS